MADAVETIKAWQCIGCGRVEATAPCVGICRDEPVELVNAAAYRVAMARAEALEEVVRRIALTFPKAGESERAWMALQQAARKAMDLAPGPTARGEGALAKSGATGQ
jgi:hypothetical protein